MANNDRPVSTGGDFKKALSNNTLMEELQDLINKWKVQVDTKQQMIIDSIYVNERRRLRGEQYQLELCIKDAEMLLAKVLNSELNSK